MHGVNKLKIFSNDHLCDTVLLEQFIRMNNEDNAWPEVQKRNLIKY
jgi:hypothetical protein